MIERITKHIADLQNMRQRGDDRPNIPYIIETLESMLAYFANEKMDQTTLKRLTRGLGRLVADDFEFSESPVGNDLLHIISDITRMRENSH